MEELALLGKGKRLRKLFFNMLYISAFTFGGGFAIVTFFKKKFVDQLHWIDEKEMIDLIALSQSGPGAIAVNAAILIGRHIAGFYGMLAAVGGTILPPIFILTCVSYIYTAFITNQFIALLLKGMQAGIAAILLDVAYTLIKNVLKEHSLLYASIMIISFVAVFFFKINVLFVLLASILLGIICTFYTRKRDDRQ